ncbi:MAG: helix-turn-helix domain-containing protein [Planctomycetales bacterium]|nr:helix-turn-helix domain-containing protein [Planctomycetales bacterium]
MYDRSATNDLQLLTVKQAAKRLSCSVANIYALIEQGTLAVISIGKSKGYRLDTADLEDFVNQRKFRFQGPRPAAPKTKLKHIKL